MLCHMLLTLLSVVFTDQIAGLLYAGVSVSLDNWIRKLRFTWNQSPAHVFVLLRCRCPSSGSSENFFVEKHTKTNLPY